MEYCQWFTIELHKDKTAELLVAMAVSDYHMPFVITADTDSLIMDGCISLKAYLEFHVRF